MGASCAPSLIDSPGVRDTTLARPGGGWQAWLAAALLALAAGCSSAPLAGKSCPCATEQGVTNIVTQCMTPPPPPCTSVTLTNTVITHDGGPHLGDGGAADSVQFGTEPEGWVSYTFQSDGQKIPVVEMTPDGNGIRIMASIDVTASNPLYAGAGVSFLGNDCIDGTNLTGVRFEFAGGLGASQLLVGVIADEDVSKASGDARGTCTGDKNMCFGPMAHVDATPGMHWVDFEMLTGGNPVLKLNVGHIIDVQWQLPPVPIANADFTISNVQFY
jgi:hypothetical protein